MDQWRKVSDELRKLSRSSVMRLLGLADKGAALFTTFSRIENVIWIFVNKAPKRGKNYMG